MDAPGVSLIEVSLVQFSQSVVSNPLRPHGLEHARSPCPSPAPRAYSNSCPLSQWCHPTISSSVIPLSSCLQSFPASGSCPMSQFFTSGGQIVGVSASASVLLINIQDWFPLGWTSWISLQSKGLSRVFSKKWFFLSEEINKYVIPSLTNVHKFDCQINIVEILCHLTLTLSRYLLSNTNLTCFLENSISEHNTEMWRTLLSDAIVSKEGTWGIISGCPSYGSLWYALT